MASLWDKLKILSAVNRVYNEAKGEVNMGKSLFKSKTFWMNVCALGVTVAGVAPEKYSVPALAILNIFMRILTDQPVSVPGLPSA